MYQRWPKEKAQRLKELYSSGLSIGEIAELFGCTWSNIRFRMAHYGIPIRSLVEAWELRRKKYPQTAEIQEKKRQTMIRLHRDTNRWSGQSQALINYYVQHPEKRAICGIADQTNRVCLPETRRKLSEASKGKKHWHWRDGTGSFPYSPEFNAIKHLVRERDGYICQKCGNGPVGRELDVHHKDHNKQNNSLDNLITLCHRCNILEDLLYA